MRDSQGGGKLHWQGASFLNSILLSAHFLHLQFQLCHQRAIFKCQHKYSIYGHLVKKSYVHIFERWYGYRKIKMYQGGLFLNCFNFSLYCNVNGVRL